MARLEVTIWRNKNGARGRTGQKLPDHIKTSLYSAPISTPRVVWEQTPKAWWAAKVTTQRPDPFA